MATRKTTTTSEATMDVLQINRESIGFWVLGESPLICNAMSAKARQQLIFPSQRKTAAEKAVTLKHNPHQEFLDSMYRSRIDDSETLIVLKSTSFKKAAMGAALDLPGAKKAQIGRLVYIEGDEIGIYGIPQMMMSVTRSADIGKTPDVRTRAIFPAWCARINVSWAAPMLNLKTVSNLFQAAGVTQGVGDWRVEKGSGNYGRFSIVDEDHPQVKLLREIGNREMQIDSINTPEYYDSETEQLSTWFAEELERRGMSKMLKGAA